MPNASRKRFKLRRSNQRDLDPFTLVKDVSRERLVPRLLPTSPQFA